MASLPYPPELCPGIRRPISPSATPGIKERRVAAAHANLITHAGSAGVPGIEGATTPAQLVWRDARKDLEAQTLLFHPLMLTSETRHLG